MQNDHVPSSYFTSNFFRKVQAFFRCVLNFDFKCSKISFSNSLPLDGRSQAKGMFENSPWSQDNDLKKNSALRNQGFTVVNPRCVENKLLIQYFNPLHRFFSKDNNYLIPLLSISASNSLASSTFRQANANTPYVTISGSRSAMSIMCKTFFAPS